MIYSGRIHTRPQQPTGGRSVVQLNGMSHFFCLQNLPQITLLPSAVAFVVNAGDGNEPLSTTYRSEIGQNGPVPQPGDFATKGHLGGKEWRPMVRRMPAQRSNPISGEVSETKVGAPASVPASPIQPHQKSNFNLDPSQMPEYRSRPLKK